MPDASELSSPPNWLPLWLASSLVRRRILTALVGFHVCAVFAFTLPRTDYLQRRHWQRADVQRQFAEFAESMRELGLSEMTSEELQATLWEFSLDYREFRKVVTGPFRPYARVSEIGQRWRLFGAPKQRVGLVRIEIADASGEFRKIYQTASDEFDWNRQFFDYYRARKWVSRLHRKSRGMYCQRWAIGLSIGMAYEFPEARQVRFVVYEVALPAPGSEVEDSRDLEPGRTLATHTYDLDLVRSVFPQQVVP